MVDDPSKRTRGEGGGLQPATDSASANGSARREEADAILKLLQARLALPDLSPLELPLEMTPTPMVVGDGTPAIPGARSVDRLAGAGSAESGLGIMAHEDSAWRDPSDDRLGADRPRGPGYHPPRTPPTSIAPAPVVASFSVATEYDPKAPTKPKVRRHTTAPPPPLLFGFDRMLVWGLVLGGLFVAVIVVIVHQLALTSARHSVQNVSDRSDEARTPEITSHKPHTPESDTHAGSSSEAPSDGASGQVHAAGARSKPLGIGGGAAAQRAAARAKPTTALPRKSWIE